MDENENPFAFNREDTAEQVEPGSGSVLVGSADHLDRPDANDSSGLFGAPSTPSDGSWSFSTSKSRGGLPRVRMPVALALIVVLMAGVGSYLFLSRRSSSGGTALALSLTRDKSYRYGIQMSMQGTMNVQGQQQPFNMQMDQNVSWQVESVDGEGTATVAVTTEVVSGQLNGQPAPALPAQTTRIRVAKDGRMLSVGNLALTSPTDFGSFMPGTDQIMPLLPDHPVDVGDSWTKKFDQDLPFGMGSLKYSVDSRLLRFETVDGRRTAVIFSTMSLPLDMSIDLKKVLSATGGPGGDSIPGNPKMAFGGTMSMQQTAWFDQARGELSKASANATFDMTIEFRDFPDSATPTGEIAFDGTMSIQVQNLDSGSKPTEQELQAQRAAQDKEAQADLRNALVAAKVHFTEAQTYARFTPAAAERIESSLTYNRSARAKTGQISIRLAGKSVILLVTRSASGTVFCIGQQSGRKIAYGKRDAKTVAACRGGWR